MSSENKPKKLKSEEIVIAAPFSYVGSAGRIWKITQQTDNYWLKYLLLMPMVLMLIACAWYLVSIWYLIFGILVVPYRLVRRGQRKNKRDNFRHREILDAIERK